MSESTNTVIDPFAPHKDEHQRVIVVSKSYYYAYSGQRLMELAKKWDHFVETHTELVNCIPTHIHREEGHPMLLTVAYDAFLLDRVVTEDDKLTNKIAFTDELRLTKKEMLMLPMEHDFVFGSNLDHNITAITNLVKTKRVYKVPKESVDTIFPFVPEVPREDDNHGAALRQIMIEEEGPTVVKPKGK